MGVSVEREGRVMEESAEPTPYAVRCHQCEPNGDHLVYLTYEGYDRQMDRPEALWTCPRCGRDAQWDDDNYEARQPGEIDEETGEPLEG